MDRPPGGADAHLSAARDRTGHLTMAAQALGTWQARLLSGRSGSHVVDGGPRGIAAAGWRGPVHDAGFGLAECPAGGLLASVVTAAGGCEVALAGDSGRVGEGVVEVAEHGLGAAAGGGAAGGAGADQVFEFAAGGVAVFAAGVVAAAFGDRGEGDVEVAQEFGERGGLPGVGSVAISLA